MAVKDIIRHGLGSTTSLLLLDGYGIAATAAFEGVLLDASYRALASLTASLDGSVALSGTYNPRASLSATYDGSPALTGTYRTRVELEASGG